MIIKLVLCLFTMYHCNLLTFSLSPLFLFFFQYEAYVSASSDTDVVGSEPTLLVVDWVRDFAPTGGEMGFAGTANGLAVEDNFVRPKSLFKMSGRSEDRARMNVMEGDIKTAKPSYKVFPWGV